MSSVQTFSLHHLMKAMTSGWAKQKETISVHRESVGAMHE